MNKIDVTQHAVLWLALKQLTRFVKRFLFFALVMPLVAVIGIAIAFGLIGVVSLLWGDTSWGGAIQDLLDIANIYISLSPALIALAALVYFYWSRNILSGKRWTIVLALGLWGISMLLVLLGLYFHLKDYWSTPSQWHYTIPLLLVMLYGYTNPIPLLAYLFRRPDCHVFPRHPWSGDVKPLALLIQHIRTVGLHRLILGALLQAVAYLFALATAACIIWLFLEVTDFKGITKFWEETGYGLLIIGLAIPLGGVQWLLKIARSLRTPRQHKAVLENDPRPPVLYLRAFKDDGRNIEGFFSRIFRLSPYVGPSGIDEMTALQFQRVGPVVAIGQPGEKMVSPGAAKEYVDDSVWLARVKELIGKASVIVVSVGDTNGLQLEYEALTQAGTKQIVIIFPPFLSEEEMLVRWEMFLNGLGKYFDLPAFDPRIRALLLRKGSPVLTICADFPEPAFMELVLAHAANAALAPSLPKDTSPASI
jgi:hypothetical protein